jgi:hypothetical protein
MSVEIPRESLLDVTKTETPVIDEYLNLLRDSIIGIIHPDRFRSFGNPPWWFKPIRAILGSWNLELV